MEHDGSESFQYTAKFFSFSELLINRRQGKISCQDFAHHCLKYYVKSNCDGAEQAWYFEERNRLPEIVPQ